MKIKIARREAAKGFSSSKKTIRPGFGMIFRIKPLFLLASCAAFAFFTAESIAQAPGTEVEYKLGPGDKIFINVFGEADLSMEIRLDETGRLNYPYLGALQIAGLGVTELEQRITAGLKGRYLLDPAVTVSIIEYRPFYLHGEVNRPGSYPYQAGLTLDKAIALGGGFTARAHKSKITVNPANDSSQEAKPIDLNDAVQAGDVITVPERFF